MKLFFSETCNSSIELNFKAENFKLWNSFRENRIKNNSTADNSRVGTERNRFDLQREATCCFSGFPSKRLKQTGSAVKNGALHRLLCANQPQRGIPRPAYQVDRTYDGPTVYCRRSMTSKSFICGFDKKGGVGVEFAKAGLALLTAISRNWTEESATAAGSRCVPKENVLVFFCHPRSVCNAKCVFVCITIYSGS